MEAYQQLYDRMHNKNVMITYKGEMTGPLVQALMDTVESRLRCVEQNLKVRKKLYNIMVECLQNIIHHQEFEGPYNCHEHITLLMLTHEEHGYCLRAGNMIANENIQKLKSWLDMVNTFPTSDLRELYRVILGDGRFSNKGTAGLGFIDIARKSGQKLNYAFQSLNEKYSIFSFYVMVPTALAVN